MLYKSPGIVRIVKTYLVERAVRAEEMNTAYNILCGKSSLIGGTR
jgi:hypothetical protein